MPLKEGGLRGPSYSQTIVNRSNGEGSRHPTFKPPPDLRSQLLTEGTFKDKEMDIEIGTALVTHKRITTMATRKVYSASTTSPKIHH
jgi:hypothetical protein